jgi:integrase
MRRVGRREIWRALGTANPAVARARAAVVSQRAFALWGALRADMKLTKDQIDQLVIDYFHDALKSDEAIRVVDFPHNGGARDSLLLEHFRVAGFSDEEIDATIQDSGKQPWHFVLDQVNKTVHDCMEIALQQNDWREGKLVADFLLEDRGIKLEEDGPEYRLLCQGLLRALRDSSRIKLLRSQGDWSGEPLDPLFRRPRAEVLPVPQPPEIPREKPALNELVENFLAEKKGITPKFADDHRAAIKAFEQTLKHPERWYEGTRRDVAHFKDLLLQTPANWTKLYKGKTLPEAVKLAEKSDKPRLSARTVNDKYLSLVSAVLKWTVNNGYITSNPAEGVKVEQAKGAKKKKPRAPFNHAHLKRIFAAPVFTGCKSDKKTAEPGNHRVRDHRYWVPLIALFSGARLNEIGQLARDDVREIDGVLCFRITISEGDGRHLKTEAAERVVPVHSELVKLGLPAYVASIRAKDHDRLFPRWQKGKDGYYSSIFSKWFARFMDSVDLRDKKLVFHSFRHTFIDALRAVNTPKDVRAALVGHEEGDVEGVYGRGYPPRTLLETVDKVSYPGLDLSRLYPS